MRKQKKLSWYLNLDAAPISNTNDVHVGDILDKYPNGCNAD